MRSVTEMRQSIDSTLKLRQEESLSRAHRDAGKAISMLNDRRVVIKGATDYSIPESHLTEMHHLVSERQTEVE